MLKKILMLFLTVGFFGLTFAGERNVPAPATVNSYKSALIICPDVCKNLQPVPGQWDVVNSMKHDTGWHVSDDKHFCKCTFKRACRIPVNSKNKCSADDKVLDISKIGCRQVSGAKYWSDEKGEKCISLEARVHFNGGEE